MKKEFGKTVRCAIYTRVSSDSGLEQDFNSLDAQHEASQAYIKSQAHAGWTLIRTRYDDGGYSGGSTERPALQRLLEDVKGRKVDIIVVYKVDRLTRSLSDFAKLVELFDSHDVSFVSVTQQFNTTTSMGRLTLNVLLSFAQFEREVTSERIRDKIAASKRKGLWVGGVVALGYETKDRKIVINEKEAETVQEIFRRYLELGSLNRLLVDLRERNVVTKIRKHKGGRVVGGISFTRGPLGHLLRNRFYIGEVDFKGEILKGEQPPILDRKLFDAVQAKLEEQRNNKAVKQTKSQALLAGIIVDDRGNRMGPTYACKGNIRYRYYASTVLTQAQADLAGSITRVPAVPVETLVIKAVRGHLGKSAERDDRKLVLENVRKVEVRATELAIELAQAENDSIRNNKKSNVIITLPCRRLSGRRKREVIVLASHSADQTRPIRVEDRARLLTAIAKARRWVRELTRGEVPGIEQIAARERCTTRKVNMVLSLAFLAPNLVKAAIEGSLPRGIGMVRLSAVPTEWRRQYTTLGIS
jgi:DNA invertase Pin-like site-specific DNA recombinase